ncbi:SAM-dependent methyltransferase [Ectothiorhodospira shaposhnikovii]|uniref:SAM-dependent methyltransferase n=1 Tax=Ectothiorhodospira shaposhnikovii TaxID=1054 RepID=UPI001EE79C44|nr:cyclopropane-fatty-acyl-phospholipid synthase family protein [Ectothiorhodospira shaposhnikovii]MCG5511827.1 cyclopropane-fatty-acyl-phospholipid synthase family protein [Ectothiorhodospira shaposhnikovii]
MSLEQTPTQGSTSTLASRAPSLALRLLLRHLRHLHQGDLTIETPDGHRWTIEGRHPGGSGEIRIHRPFALVRRLLTRGLVGFGEGYMVGDWDSPDLPALLNMGAVNQPHIPHLVNGSRPAHLWDSLRHRLRGNSRPGSRRNIAFHYDLGNDFYQQWLDPTMTYSAAVFEQPEESLETAQTRKYARLLERLEAAPGAHILEIGCGWGGFAEHAARQGYRVTGITLSREQLDYARRRIKAAGLSDRVELRLQDYRDLKEQFDHVVSIEMFEAVGERWWPTWFRIVRQCLRPGGRAAVQVITIDVKAFDYYRTHADFIQLYIFPGGMLPSVPAFEQHATEAGLKIRETAFFGQDYADTLHHWYQRVCEQAPAILSLGGYDQRFLRTWRFYLAYCEAGFRSRNTDLMHAVLEAK